MASLAELAQSFLSKGTSASPVNVQSIQGAPTAANVLDGFQSVAVTTGATTLVTIPAGRTWVGKIGASVSVQNAAANAVAGRTSAAFSVAGAGAVPTGNVFEVDCLCGANAAAGTVGSQSSSSSQTDLTVIAPAGNAVTIQVTTTLTGSAGIASSYAIGQLI